MAEGTLPMSSRSFSRKLGLARLAVTFERLYPALFPALLVLAGFLALSLFDVWRAVPVWLHMAGLLGFAAALMWSIYRVRDRFRLVSRDAGLARLERDSAARHQPLRALEDRLADDWQDPAGQALWRRHRERVLAALGRVRLAPPRSALPTRDPWAVRALALLVLVVAVVDARGDAGQRLLRAFVPGTAGAVALPIEVSLWVTPPHYTGRPPLTIEQTRRLQSLDVPIGSEAVLQLHNLPLGADGRPEVLFNGEALGLEALGERSGEVRLDLVTAGQLEVRKTGGEPLAGWQVAVLVDHPPEIAFAQPPRATHRSVLELGYEASDDYGISRVALEFALAERPEERDRAVLAEPARAPTEVASTTYLDLTAHPLAGLEVTLHLVAEDGLGQVGTSEPVVMVLPERVFEHPLARAVIAERRRLVREPNARRAVTAALGELAESRLAEQAGTSVQLGLAVAQARLRGARSAEERRSVVDLLWELALMIEDGGLSVAERSLREIQEALQRALEEGASEAELEALMDELREAMDRYLEELTRQALEQMRNMPPNMQMQPIDPSQMVDRQSLQEMIDRAEEMMQSGAREQAQAMLEQLQQMLENLQAGVPQMQPHPGEQALSDLQRMIELQQNLLDRSYQMQQGQPGQQGEPGQQGQQGQEGQQGQQGSGQAAAEQDALRRALGELMRRLGEAGMDIPRALGQAEMQMRGARDALQEGQPGQAVGPQGDAIDLMQQGGQAMLDELREQMANQPGGGQGFGPAQMGRQREGRDPLGRASRNEGGWDSEGTEIPAENDLGRARDVLEELYRRSRDQGRPQEELDYFDRLLERF
ncbi:MAG: TIGR02302 family protein [Geminicoccaceae bacterium]